MFLHGAMNCPDLILREQGQAIAALHGADEGSRDITISSWVDVSKVDPKNCDTSEMYAYTASLKDFQVFNKHQDILIIRCDLDIGKK